MKRIYLIDCPGVVPPSNNDSEQDILLRGVVRVENVEHPEQYIAAVMNKTKPQHIERTYNVRGYNTPTEFLELLARKGGRLLKGGEADVDAAAKMVLNDFLRGKIPWYTPPPVVEGETKGIEGREGRLGEMGKKRKREDEASTNNDPETIMPNPESTPLEHDFEGFDDKTGEVSTTENNEGLLSETGGRLDKSDVEDDDSKSESQTDENG